MMVSFLKQAASFWWQQTEKELLSLCAGDKINSKKEMSLAALASFLSFFFSFLLPHKGKTRLDKQGAAEKNRGALCGLS